MMMKLIGDMKSSFMIGTHHKTGTVFMAAVFSEFSKESGRQFSTVTRRDITNGDLTAPFVLFDGDSLFSDPDHLLNNITGISVVRHPKDQIISSTRYHSSCAEEWALQPLDIFNGMSYQQAINNIDTWAGKIEFEMKYFYSQECLRILRTNKKLMKIHYEDLIDQNKYTEIIDTICNILKFSPSDKKIFIDKFNKYHINNNYSSDHIINGSINQHLEFWPGECDDYYNKNYKHLEKRLGY